MPIPTLITDLLITAAQNSPAGGESVTTTDDYLRAQAAFIAQLRDRVQPVALGGTGATTANAGADALGAFRRGTLLGTVSQTTGVPTGAVIERGSNVNGEYVRFADGTQICRVGFADVTLAANALGSLVAWSYPAAFAVVPCATASCYPLTSNDQYGIVSMNGVLSSAAPVIRNGATAQTFTGIQAVAIGRWF